MHTSHPLHTPPKGSRKKSSPFKEGGGVKGRAIKEKRIFFRNLFFQRSNLPTAIKLEGAI